MFQRIVYGNYKTYNFFSYNDFKIWTSWGPDGSHVSKTNVPITGPYTSLVISNINAFATSHASMKYNLAQTLIALGVAAVTWETVVGLVGSGLTGVWLMIVHKLDQVLNKHIIIFNVCNFRLKSNKISKGDIKPLLILF
ncbi:hypothetical protein BK134_19845 [Paenibacillus peoriae]|nr:hypothetical protein BK134_19845 [Paenibacillus peoriae]